MKLNFQNTFARLPESFFKKTEPTPVIQPSIIAVNDGLANELGIDPDFLRSDQGLAILAGNSIPEGAEPLAMAYAGHQFGGFSPQLGDGRAILIGEIGGKDIQLKGAGPTPFSRRGDGRSALGPVLREYLVSEAMYALGIPTTRALAAVLSGELVLREQPEKGGIFTRVASSHLRIGTAQYFAARNDTESLKDLVKYAIQRHNLQASNAFELFQDVIRKQALLVAQWMGFGFIHGVMNTDNMSLSGETIDYGPCAFMDRFNPTQKFSYIDQNGRYAYSNQLGIAQWNLTRLAEALLPLFDEDQEKAVTMAKEELEKFLGESAKYRGWVFDLVMVLNQIDPSLANELKKVMETCGNEEEKWDHKGRMDNDIWEKYHSELYAVISGWIEGSAKTALKGLHDKDRTMDGFKVLAAS